MKTSTLSSRAIPIWLKLAYTAFIAILIPVYWRQYGPTNFFYFCDVALLLTLAGVWLEHPLLISLPTVGILMPQVLWCVDFAVQLSGGELTRSTKYMFDETIPRFTRGLSLYHGWMPFLLVYLVFKLGYDRRAFKGWSAFAAGLCVFSFFVLPKARNVNYVFGMEGVRPPHWMGTELYLVSWIAVLTVMVFLPTHALLKQFCPTPEEAAIKRG